MVKPKFKICMGATFRVARDRAMIFPYPLDSKAYEHKWVIFPTLMKTNKAEHVSDSTALSGERLSAFHPHFTIDVGPRLISYLGKTSQMAEVGTLWKPIRTINAADTISKNHTTRKLMRAITRLRTSYGCAVISPMQSTVVNRSIGPVRDRFQDQPRRAYLSKFRRGRSSTTTQGQGPALEYGPDSVPPNRWRMHKIATRFARAQGKTNAITRDPSI